MDQNFLKAKLESACAQLIAGLDGAPATIVKGRDVGELTRDRVLVSCKGGPEVPTGSGNRHLVLVVAVISGADPDEEAEETAAAALERHNANCAAVFNGLGAIEDLAAELTDKEEDFHVFQGGVEDIGEDPDIEARGWVENRQYRVYCTGIDLE